MLILTPSQYYAMSVAQKKLTDEQFQRVMDHVKANLGSKEPMATIMAKALIHVTGFELPPPYAPMPPHFSIELLNSIRRMRQGPDHGLN